MNNVLLIGRRELGGYFRSLSGWLMFALVLLVNGLLFNYFALGDSERRSAQVLHEFFFYSSGVFMTATIFFSMRLLAEEKQIGTIVLLTSSPVKDHEIILGKYLSALAFLAIVMLTTVYMPLLVLVNGKISYGHLFAGYLGLLLLSGTTLALGTFGSALARTQILAAIFSGILVVLFITCWFGARVTERPFNELFVALALFHRHFTPFMDGVIHTRDVVYYLAMIYFALFASTRVLEARRWR